MKDEALNYRWVFKKALTDTLDFLLQLAPLMLILLWFTVLGAVYYDFVWSIFDLLASGRGVPLGPFALSLGTCAILWFYDGKHRFLKLKPRFYLLQIMFLSSVTILALTGFYQTLHAGIDPHPGNWLWALSKFTGIWAWSGTYLKRGGLE